MTVGHHSASTPTGRSRPAARTRGAPPLVWLGIVLALLVGVAGGYALRWGLQPSETALPKEYMTSQRIAERWMSALESKDLNKLVPLYSRDATWDDQAMDLHYEGRDVARHGWDMFSLPGFEVKELEIAAVDAHGAAVRWTLVASQSPFTGRPWKLSGVSVLAISGGEITAETVYYDSDELMT